MSRLPIIDRLSRGYSHHRLAGGMFHLATLIGIMLIICSSSALFGIEPPHPYPFGAAGLPADPSVVFGTLDNGVGYALMPNREPRGRVSLRLLVHTGSLHERDGQRGLAHYLEHMAFKGTENFAAGTLVEYFQNLGMSFGPDANAYTAFDRTVYQIELPEQDERMITDALTVLRDFADRMLITEAEVSAERGVILSEKRTRDSVRFRTALAEYTFLLPDAIVSERFPIGAAEVIQATTSADLREFYEAWYRPDRTRLIVVGDLSPEPVIALINEHFGDFSAMAPSVAMPDKGRITRREFDIGFHAEPEAPSIRVSLQTVHPYDAGPDTLERRRQRLIRSTALQMLTRRLERLAEEPDAPFSRGTATVYDLFDFVSNASVDLITQPTSWDAALRIAEQELRRALTFGFHDVELNEVRANLLNAFEERAHRAPTRQSRDLAEQLAGALVSGRVFMDPRAELQFVRDILAAMDTDVCEAALRKLFPDDHRLVFVTGNLAMEDPAASIQAAYRAAATIEVDPLPPPDDTPFAYPLPPTVGAIAQRTHIDDLDIHQIRFENQVMATLKATDFSSNQVLIAVRIGSGLLTEPADQPGLATLASEVLLPGGLGEHSADALRRLFAGRNVGWSFNVEPDTFIFRGTTTAADLTAQLTLLRAYLTDPGWREEALRLAREHFDQMIIDARHTASGVLRNEVNRFLAGGDPRFGLPDRDDFMGYELEDVRAWILPALQRGCLEISLIGDLPDLDAAIEAVALALGTLPERDAGKPDFADRRVITRPPAGTDKRIEFESRIPSGYAAVYWPIPDMWTMSRTRRLSILARVFSDRMRIRIRESLGEAYSAHAVSHPSDTYTDYGWFYGIVPVAADKADRVAAEIESIAADLHDGNIVEDELQRALRPVLASLRDALRDNRYWLNSVLISAWEHPDRLEWARSMTDDFLSIDLDDLKDLAHTYLDPSQRIRVEVIPVAPANP